MTTLRLRDEPVSPAFDFVAHPDPALGHAGRLPVGMTERSTIESSGVAAPSSPANKIFMWRARSATVSAPIVIEPTAVTGAAATYRRSKRLLDVIVATCGLAITAPVIATLGLLIRLDSPGPAFFRQLRVGESGRLFTMLKLRTMYDGESQSHDVNDSTGTELHRVTRVGRYLRRWSLDEIPQFINVLRGDMSVVGPRPERPEVVLSHYRQRQYQRFTVPQGMTGWWQVTERGRTPLRQDMESDLFYVSRASLKFDMKILLMTLPALVRQARGV